LVYSLLRQALELLPPKVDTTIDMSTVGDLDGSISGCDRALELFDTALENGKPIVYCVIDGLQEDEEVTTWKYLDKLVKLLKRRAAPIADQSVKVKVLMTATGRCRSFRNMSRSERILANDWSNGVRGLRVFQPLR
jgi:hypothetical protein